ncbi:hypothetical protein ACLVWQ_01870 [Streptomyces sp. CWNU-52B]|uniref:hypothetical protein n=1 Tax=unclassified Streptomyces TaxID=2593676 RepID=UPI0039BFBEB4
MSTFNFHGDINGPANFGDHGRIEVSNGPDPAQSLRLAADLVELLRTENPRLVAPAEVVRGELARAGQDGAAPDRGRVRSALETISVGVAAGSGGLALAQELSRVLGL